MALEVGNNIVDEELATLTAQVSSPAISQPASPSEKQSSAPQSQLPSNAELEQPDKQLDPTVSHPCVSTMKLQRTTLILLLLALGLGGFVYFYEIRGATQRQEAEVREQQIFAFTQEQVQTLNIQTQGQTLGFERNQNGQWVMTSPEKTPASNASISYLLDLLVQGRSDRTIQVPTNQLADYGLADPQATVIVTLNNQQTHQLNLGNADFSGNSLYAQADPGNNPSGNVDLLLVSADFQNAVNRDLAEWRIENDTPDADNPTPQTPTPASPSPSP
ncbi:DUF4340 domain-containing protein [Gloeocapsopsis crepidinum]|nr:DUF4340 domain-containing protein [Gloeocapsopsis crepidinum]